MPSSRPRDRTNISYVSCIDRSHLGSPSLIMHVKNLFLCQWGGKKLTGRRNNVMMCSVTCYVWFCATLWTVACEVPPSMGFSKARILEWVAMPSSRVSSQPKDQTSGISWVFCLAGEFFTAEPPGEAWWNNRNVPYFVLCDHYTGNCDC